MDKRHLFHTLLALCSIFLFACSAPDDGDQSSGNALHFGSSTNGGSSNGGGSNGGSSNGGSSNGGSSNGGSSNGGSSNGGSSNGGSSNGGSSNGGSSNGGSSNGGSSNGGSGNGSAVNCSNPTADFSPDFRLFFNTIFLGFGGYGYGLTVPHVNGLEPVYVPGFGDSFVIQLSQLGDNLTVDLSQSISKHDYATDKNIPQPQMLAGLDGTQIGVDLEGDPQIEWPRNVRSEVRIENAGLPSLVANLALPGASVLEKASVKVSNALLGGSGTYYSYMIQIVEYYNSKDQCGYLETHANLLFQP